jgi:hypothetical protein
MPLLLNHAAGEDLFDVRYRAKAFGYMNGRLFVCAEQAGPGMICVGR